MPNRHADAPAVLAAQPTPPHTSRPMPQAPARPPRSQLADAEDVQGNADEDDDDLFRSPPRLMRRELFALFQESDGEDEL